MSEAPMGACCSAIDDPERLAAVARIAEQNLEARQDLDALARLTAYAFKAPICLISLVSDASVRFLGKFGMQAREVPLEECLCTQVVLREGPVEVLNLSTDPELCDHKVAIEPPYVRAYCGQPLLSPEGLIVGTVGVIDTAPFYRFGDEDREALRAATDIARRLLFGAELEALQSEAAE